ncbi:MAG: hypothetical protein IJ148_09275 [Bacteroidaceae bacterium]|nr:hypothetical protein [Bacteroidaceae bacterium]
MFTRTATGCTYSPFLRWLLNASDIVIIVFATTGSERHHSKDKAKHEA